MARLITGLDIGTSTIKCIVAEEKKNGVLSVLSVVRAPSLGFQRGVLVDVEAATHALRELVLDLQKISRTATTNVLVNLNSAQVRTRISRGLTAVARADKEIQQDDIDKAIQLAQAVKRQENYMILHNIVREYFVDDVGNIHDPIGMTGSRLEASVFIIEAFMPQVNLVAKTLEKVGMRTGGFVFNPLASSRSVLTKPQKDLGVLLIDFGFQTTSFVVYEEGKISYARSLPVGSQHATSDLAIGLQVSVEAAEKIKITVGNALSENVSLREEVTLSEFERKNDAVIKRRRIAEIIEARLAETLELMNNELKSLGKATRFPSGIVITGGGSKLQGLSDLIQKGMKSYIQFGFSDTRELEILNPTHRDYLEDPEFSAALGLLYLAEGGDGRPRNFREFFRNFFRNIIP